MFSTLYNDLNCLSHNNKELLLEHPYVRDNYMSNSQKQ